MNTLKETLDYLSLNYPRSHVNVLTLDMIHFGNSSLTILEALKLLEPILDYTVRWVDDIDEDNITIFINAKKKKLDL